MLYKIAKKCPPLNGLLNKIYIADKQHQQLQMSMNQNKDNPAQNSGQVSNDNKNSKRQNSNHDSGEIEGKKHKEKHERKKSKKDRSNLRAKINDLDDFKVPTDEEIHKINLQFILNNFDYNQYEKQKKKIIDMNLPDEYIGWFCCKLCISTKEKDIDMKLALKLVKGATRKTKKSTFFTCFGGRKMCKGAQKNFF